MDVSETDLPGVGKRYEVPIEEGGVVVVVIHNSGRRELFYRETPDADAEEILDLTDPESRVIGSILEGSYFQPVRTDLAATAIGEDVIIEWYTLEDDTPIVGETLGESAIREETGVTVIAIERDDDVVPSPEVDVTFRSGDIVICVGTREQQAALEALLGEESSDE